MMMIQLMIEGGRGGAITAIKATTVTMVTTA